jgi:hypothetical protein
VKKIEIFVGSDSAFEKIIPQNARNLTELATQLDDDNKKMEMNVIIPGQPKPKTQKKRKPIVRNLVIHADEYCSVQEHVIINFINLYEIRKGEFEGNEYVIMKMDRDNFIIFPEYDDGEGGIQIPFSLSIYKNSLLDAINSYAQEKGVI